jgi:PAS domain S-box-containing protein
VFRRVFRAAAPVADAAPAVPGGIALGVALVAAAGAVRLAADPILGAQAPFLMHIPAVVLAAWFGGLAGGITAAIAGALVVDFLFIDPRHILGFYLPGRSGGVLLFGAVSLGLAWQVDRWRRAERNLRFVLAERRRTEAVLQRYELLAHHTRDIVLFVRRHDGRILEANAAAEAAYGYPREELLARTIYDLRGADDAALVEDQMAAAHAGGIQFQAEHRRSNGTTFPVEVSSLGMTLGGDSVLLSVVRDITERARTEHSLRESERRMGALLNAVTESIVLLDVDGHVQLANATALGRLGLRSEDMIGRPFEHLLPAGVAEARRARFDEVMRTGEPARFADERAGMIFDHTFYPVRDEDGHVSGVAWFSRDHTARTRAEEQRAEAMARLALLLDVSESLSAAATPEQITEILLQRAVPAMGAYAGVIALVSETGEDVTVLGSRGYPAGTTEGFGRIPLTADLPLTEAIRTDSIVTVSSRDEWRRRYPSSTPARTGTTSEAIAAIPFRGSRISGAIGLSFLEPRELNARDETFATLLARQAAQALERADLLVSERHAHTEAAQAGRIKDEFLATLSHELRTPLNAILGWSHMLQANALPADARKHAIDVIARNASSQVRLVEEVLDISRIVRGQLHLDVQGVDLRAVIERAIDTVRPAADAKGLAIESSLPEQMATVGDGERLQQVVWNLLSNAVKFTPAGGRVTVRARRQPGHVLVEVRDTGVGIPPEFLPHVFERFTQADSSSTRRYGGLGLGLAIVRHIVELHGGTVAAESGGTHAGACFRIRLPRREVPATVTEELHRPGDEPPAALPSLAGLVVLVVDGSDDAREVVATILAGAGANVVRASSALEGLELVLKTAPDVLISDIAMPAQDGHWLIRQVRALAGPASCVPAIALTALGGPDVRALALAAGFDRQETKPLSPQTLVAVVASARRSAATAPD